MSYKLALHMLVTFPEQVVQFINILQFFILNDLDFKNKNSQNETNENGSGEVVSPHCHYTFIEYLTGLV